MSTSRTELKRRMFMEVAHTIAQLSTCPRKAVGAVLIRNGRCISWGYNGSPPGLPHCQHPIDQPCETATHAEFNAVIAAARVGIATDASELFVTISPCIVCSRLIIASGITHVYYTEEYRDDAGIKLLEQSLIPCRRIDEVQ